MPQDVDKYIDQIKTDNDFFIKAKLLRHLVREKGLRIVDLSKRLDWNPSFICHILRLNRIPDIVRDGYYDKQISISHLFIISRLKEPQQIIALYEKLLSNNFTVIQTEELVREILYQIKSKGQYLINETLNQYINNVESKYKNSTIKIIQTRIKSKIVMEIKGNLSETSAILTKILDKLVE